MSATAAATGGGAGASNPSNLEAQALLGEATGGKPRRLLSATSKTQLCTLHKCRNLELWRLITPLFLHANLLHLLFNLIFILHIGLNMEEKYGTANFVLLYFISGIIGGMITEILLIWNQLGERARMIYFTDLAFFGVFSILFSLGRGAVDFYGHLGGLLAGIAIISALNRGVPDLHPWHPLLTYGSAIACTLIVVGAFLRVFLGIPYPMSCPPAPY